MIKAAREKHPPVYSLSVDGVIDAYLAKRLSIYLSTMYARNLYRNQSRVCSRAEQRGSRIKINDHHTVLN